MQVKTCMSSAGICLHVNIARLRWVALALAFAAMFVWLSIRDWGPDIFGAAFFPALRIAHSVAE